MHILGIIGGIASGKSLITRRLGQLGAVVLDADRVAHEVLRQQEVKQALAARWGSAILNAEGEIDRSAVAERIFSDSSANPGAGAEERRFLEGIIHPPIRRRFEKRIAQLQEGQGRVVALDAPLLVEAGWETLCSDVIFVDCSEDIRKNRAVGRGWTEREFEQREAAQMPIIEKRGRSTIQISNQGTPAELASVVEQLWLDRWARCG
jgi:dephospho-CoA kinase